MEQVKNLLPHQHPLAVSSGGFNCDVCRANRSSRRYKCVKGCNWDLCGECLDKLIPNLMEAILNPQQPSTTISPQVNTNNPEKISNTSNLPLPKPSSLQEAINNNICTFSFTGARFQQQRYYNCLTCGLIGGNAVCASCLKVCHVGHKTQEHSNSPNNFYCDCGNGSSCKCLWKPDLTVQVQSPETQTNQTQTSQTQTTQTQTTPNPPKEEKTPPGASLHRHPLKENNSRGNAWSCDGCRKSGKVAKSRFRCASGCDFDLCETCYLGVEEDTGGKKDFNKVAVLVRPGQEKYTNLPPRDLFDERQTKFWSTHRAPFVNQIIFSNKPIERLFESDILTNQFKQGDEIYGRAIWDRAIRNFPIGYVDSEGGKVPVYGPTFILSDSYGHYNLHALDLFVFVKINGEKEVGRKAELYGKEIQERPYQFCSEVGPIPTGSSRGMANYNSCLKYEIDPSKTDFYAMNQSIVLHILKQNFEKGDSWQNGIPVLAKMLSELTPGKHTVKVDLRYRISANISEIERWESMGWINWRDETQPQFNFPKVQTAISFPIAEGEFEYIAEGGGEVISPFPKRNSGLNDTEATRLEQIIFDYMKVSPGWGKRGDKTENILHVTLNGNWFQYEKSHQCTNSCREPCPIWNNEPLTYGISFYCTVYRSPLHGWQKEMPCSVFSLSVMSQTQNLQSLNDIHNVGVGGKYDFDVDMVPDDHFQKVGLKRCPPNLRGGLL